MSEVWVRKWHVAHGRELTRTPHRALGDMEQAKQRILQALELMPEDTSSIRA